ncbi:radical SAM protein [Labilibaculum euxinus]
MISIPTKEKGLTFLLNPENGKWIYTNNPTQYYNRIQGDVQLKSLKGTELVLLNVGRECNLRCKYCFVGDKREENENMSLEIAKKTLDSVSQMKNGDKKIVFHGSEPLMNFELIKNVVEYGNELDKEIKYSVQTNGTLLKPEIIDFFVKNKVYVGMSLDGLKRSHNKTRPFIGGKGSFDRVINNLAQLGEQQEITSFICVITKHNVSELNKIVELGKKMNTHTIAFNSVLSSDPSIIPDESALTENLIKITDNYLYDLLNGNRTPILDHPKRYLSLILNTEKFSNSCSQCATGSSNPLVAVDIDGTLYPCDHFWGEKKFAIGHIENMTIDEASTSIKNFRNDREFGEVEDCLKCDWKRICSGGCPGGRILSNKGQYCETTKDMLKYFIERIPLLKENGLLKKILCE